MIHGAAQETFIIIEAVAESHLWGAGFANFAVLAGVFVTAFYSFRMYFLVFHGEERFGKAHAHDAHAAFAVARFNGALYGRSPAPARQE